MDADPKTLECTWPTVAEAPVASVRPVSGQGTTVARHPLCLKCHVLDALPNEHLPLADDGLPAAVRIPLRAGARLFERGTTGRAIYVLQSGIVKEVMPTPDGGECTVRLVMHGGISGLSAVLREPHRHSAYVVHPGYACRVPVERIERLRADEPHAVERLFADWQQAVDDADRILSGLGRGPARARLARALLHLRSTLVPGEPLRLRRDDLAALIAVTPASVARLMGEFRREGLLEMRGRSCVGIDVDRLRPIAIATGH